MIRRHLSVIRPSSNSNSNNSSNQVDNRGSVVMEGRGCDDLMEWIMCLWLTIHRSDSLSDSPLPSLHLSGSHSPSLWLSLPLPLSLALSPSLLLAVFVWLPRSVGRSAAPLLPLLLPTECDGGFFVWHLPALRL